MLSLASYIGESDSKFIGSVENMNKQ